MHEIRVGEHTDANNNRYVHTQETLDEWDIVGFPQFVEFVDIKAMYN